MKRRQSGDESDKCSIDSDVEAMNIVSSASEIAAYKLSMESHETGDLFPEKWIKKWGPDVWNAVFDCFGNGGDLAGSLVDTLVLGSNLYTPLLGTADDWQSTADLYEEVVASFERNNKTLRKQIIRHVFKASNEVAVLSDAGARSVGIYRAAVSYQKLLHEFFSALSRLNRQLGSNAEGFLVIKRIFEKLKELRRTASRPADSSRKNKVEIVKHVQRLNATNSFIRGLVSANGDIGLDGDSLPSFLKTAVREAQKAEMARLVSETISGSSADGGVVKPTNTGSTKAQKQEDFRALLKSLREENGDFVEKEQPTPSKLSASGSANRGCVICNSASHFHYDCPKLPERGQRRKIVADLIKNLDTATNKGILSRIGLTKKRASDAIRNAIQ